MSLSSSEGKSGLICPTCGRINDLRELACYNCGSLFPVSTSTPRLADLEATKASDEVSEPQAIRFEIDGKELIIPLSTTVVLGRRTAIPDESQPDIDLSAYDAGISRKHLQIKRKAILIYVSDMGSTNGTLLNGHRLVPLAERLLRSGDELQLGSLKIRVRF